MNELLFIAALWPSLGLEPTAPTVPAPDGSAAVVLADDGRVLKPGVEIGYGTRVAVAHLPRRIAAPISVPGVYDDLAQLPSIRPGFLGFEASLGWRFDRLPGDFLVNVQVGSTGQRSLIDGLAPTGPSVMSTYAGLTTLVMTYNIRPRMGPVQFDFSLGARMSSITFDREALHMTLERRIETSFIGAGPGGGIGLELPLIRGLGPFVQVTSGVMFGRARQRFHDMTFTGSYPGGAPGNAFTILEFDTDRQPEGRFLMAEGRETIAQSRTVPYLTVLAGLSLTEMQARKRSFQVGYEYQQIWDPFTIGTSGGHFSTHGAVVRWLINY